MKRKKTSILSILLLYSRHLAGFINTVVCSLSMAIIFYSAAVVEASIPVKVAVLPFSVHGRENLDFLSQAIADMLSTRLESKDEIHTMEKPAIKSLMERIPKKELTRQYAQSLGEKLGVDFVVFGSISKIGEAVSLDTVLIDVAGEKPPQSIHATAQRISNISSKLKEIARRINFKILGKQVVSKVRVAGNKFIERDAILLSVHTKPGNAFSSEVLQQDLKRIYQMGYFKDVQIESIDTPLGKEITFHVVERPTIKEIQIQGNRNVKLEDIQKVMEVKLRTILDLNKVMGDEARIRKLYTDKGYYNVTVYHKLKKISKDEVGVNFYIREGKIIKVKKITFTGNENIPDKKLKKVMATREKNLLSFITSAGIYKDEALAKDIDRLTAYYYSKGYLQAKVEKPTVHFKEDGIYIDFTVDEGKRFTIGEVDFKGDLIYETRVLRSKLKSKPGKIFSSNMLNEDLVSLKQMYSKQGYAFADISPLTDIDPEKRQVAIVFSIDKGEKIYIEKIIITGNTRTRDNVIRRELRLTEGSIYNSEEINRSKQEINRLGFFKEVNFNIERGSKSNLVKLHVEVKERPTGSFSVGAGYSSVDSLVGMFQISQNNLFGKGQQLTFMAQLGGKSTRYNISFTEPWFRGTRTSVGFDLFNISRQYEDFDRDSKGLKLRSSFPVADYTRFYLGYRFEQVDVNDVDDDVALEIQRQEGTNTTGSITGSIVRDSRDDRFAPRMGSMNSFSVEVAGFGGNNKFISLIGSAAKYFPLPWDTVFMMRGTMGYIFGFAGEKVPISEKFFLGGLDSLRGFDERSVGPKEPRPNRKDKKDVVGGEKELFFNFEYIFPIIKKAGIRGVVFMDAGNAYKQSEGFFSDLRYDVGVGVRWYSPFGPLRVEWGVNLSPEEDEDSSNFAFSMGQVF